MADAIAIPADLTLLTTIVKTTKVINDPHPRRVIEETKTAPGETEARLRAAFEKVNQIWSVADIQFKLRRCSVGEIELPSGKSKVDRNDVFFLAHAFPGVRGISFVVVNAFDLSKTGGRSIEEKAFCVMPKIDDLDSYARKLAHEFGHLLGASREEHSQKLTPEQMELLAHFDEAEAKKAGWTKPRSYNLMYEGALAGSELTTSQIQRARTSTLAQASVAQTTKS
jgi:hypothetical protein